jgi:hypothetical protein
MKNTRSRIIDPTGVGWMRQHPCRRAAAGPVTAKRKSAACCDREAKIGEIVEQ